jgi:hypothetical protein
MARIVSMGPLGTLSGKIAGQVMARNRYGAYSRNFTMPINPASDKQETARAVVADLAIAWSALTPGQRAAWDTYAAAVPLIGRTGQPDYITGFNHFVRSNASRLRIAEARALDGPTTLSMPSPDNTIAISASEATQQISVVFDIAGSWRSEDMGHMMVYAGYPQPATRNFYAGKMIFVNRINGQVAVPPVSPQLITFPAELQFAAGQKLFVQHRIMRADGRLSILFQVTCVSAA